MKTNTPRMYVTNQMHIHAHICMISKRYEEISEKLMRGMNEKLEVKLEEIKYLLLLKTFQDG